MCVCVRARACVFQFHLCKWILKNMAHYFSQLCTAGVIGIVMNFYKVIKVLNYWLAGVPFSSIWEDIYHDGQEWGIMLETYWFVRAPPGQVPSKYELVSLGWFDHLPHHPKNHALLHQLITVWWQNVSSYHCWLFNHVLKRIAMEGVSRLQNCLRLDERPFVKAPVIFNIPCIQCLNWSYSSRLRYG